MKKKLVLMTSALMAMSLLSACNTHTHDWGEVTYTWSEDNKTCVAERVCKGDESHKESETAQSTYSVVTEAKCEEDGKGRYSVSFENEAFEAQTKEVKIDATDHDYQFVEFVWGNDFTAQAKYVCSHDASHIKNETATVTNEVTTPAGCETEGVRTYTASFDGHTDTKTEVIPATDHSWKTPTYVWADDNSSCTATRVCANDESHIETEIKNSVFKEVTPATCETAGVGKYVVEFENSAFTKQEKDNIVIDALGHDYQFDSFVWSDKWDSAQAKYVWSRDASHVELHDAEVEINTVPAACESTGKMTFTATYDGHTEVKEATIPAKGHNLVHVDEKAANCTEDGNVEHWHCNDCEKNFADEAGSQLLNNVVIEKLGHSWGEPTYEWNADYTECTATRVCARDGSHKETEIATATLEVVTPNTCEGNGSGTRIATFNNKAFATQTVNVVIDAKGHNYKVTYTWSDDYSQCTAKAVCQNDNTHVIEETKPSTYTFYVDNNVVKNGYLVEFESEVISDAKADVLILESINNGAAYSVKAANTDIKGAIEIPASYNDKPVTTISESGFINCNNVTSVVIPASVTELKFRAFGWMQNLTYVKFAEGSQLNTIGMQAFAVCRNLTKIEFGGTMEQWNSISKDTFWAYQVPCQVINCSDGDTPCVDSD